MWRRRKWLVAVIFLAAAGFAFREPAEKYFEVAKSLDIFATLFKEVNTYYVDDVDPEKLVKKGIDGMLQSLDPYTDYIPEEELESFRITTTGQYGGIGALIGVVRNKVVITHPYKNFPANKSGLRVGDELVAVDGKSVVGKTTSEISSLLKGQPKTEVEIKVRRFGSTGDLSFRIKREKISLNNVAFYGMVGTDIAYIKLDDFTPGAAREVAGAVKELTDKGAKKIVLDLRENPGGLLHEAVNIVSLFVPKGSEVVSTRGKATEWNKVYKTLNNPIDTQSPLVVLTSEGSASASEIVAGALQDYDRAVLIGQKTFGKGLVQTTRPLSYNAQLKVTTAKYYIPSGRCIQELDYAHRKEDGTVVKFADSLKREFQTKAGRKVFDGGGLDPDVPVTTPLLGTITIALMNGGYIFEYASKYCAENTAPASMRDFKFSDADYKKFEEWLRQSKFSYTTELEKQVNELLEASKTDGMYDDVNKELASLKSRIETVKMSDLARFRDQITQYLEDQIAFHYKLAEGQTEVSLQRDPEIQSAVKLLGDPASYKKILLPK